MGFFLVPQLDSPACADPVYLPLVDAAYKSPGGRAAKQMRKQLCSDCPAAPQCLGEAMERGEWGIWGGTGPNLRTRRGGRKPKASPHRFA